MSSVERARGRLGPNALKGVKAFTRRTADGLLPTDVYIADGHSFDAEIAHPRTGQPCRPEVTVVLDVRTRRWVGWSAALAESTWAVADALCHAVTTHGVPAIFYSDRGPGYQNAVLDALLDRLGITRERSIARNSQARGVVERFNRYLIAAAKRLPTYMGADMDADAKRLVFQRTRRELRLVGTSPLLIPWDQFAAWLEQLQAEYNARPHRGLPRHDTGRGAAHMTPAEAWSRDLAAADFVPLLPSAAEADDLFRPYELRVTRRGEVSLWGRRYFARHLEHLDGEDVLVGYDIHDASRVFVRDLDERLVAIAGLDANAAPYFPASRVEQARGRARGREKRLLAQIDEVRAELSGQPPAAQIPPRARSQEERDQDRLLRLITRRGEMTKTQLKDAVKATMSAAQRDAALLALEHDRGQARLNTAKYG